MVEKELTGQSWHNGKIFNFSISITNTGDCEENGSLCTVCKYLNSSFRFITRYMHWILASLPFSMFDFLGPTASQLCAVSVVILSEMYE